jgi:hypothetical protein
MRRIGSMTVVLGLGVLSRPDSAWRRGLRVFGFPRQGAQAALPGSASSELTNRP